MRHLGSLALSLVLGPVVWLLTGLGLSYLTEERLGGAEVSVETMIGVMLLLIAGAFYALLVMVRLSPIGPALVGLAYLGAASWSVLDRASFFDVVPNDLLGRRFAVVFPAEGYALLLAVPLLATLLSARRWRRYDGPAAAPVGYAGPAGGYASPPSFGAPPLAYPPPPNVGGPVYPTPPPGAGVTQPVHVATPTAQPISSPPISSPPISSPPGSSEATTVLSTGAASSGEETTRLLDEQTRPIDDDPERTRRI